MANIKKLSAKKFFPMLSDRQERFENAKADLCENAWAIIEDFRKKI